MLHPAQHALYKKHQWSAPAPTKALTQHVWKVHRPAMHTKKSQWNAPASTKALTQIVWKCTPPSMHRKRNQWNATAPTKTLTQNVWKLQAAQHELHESSLERPCVDESARAKCVETPRPKCTPRKNGTHLRLRNRSRKTCANCPAHHALHEKSVERPCVNERAHATCVEIAPAQHALQERSVERPCVDESAHAKYVEMLPPPNMHSKRDTWNAETVCTQCSI